MINNSKKLTKDIISVKDLSLILNLSEVQIRNILNKESKSLYNFLALSYLTNIPLQQMFKLTKEEKDELKQKREIIKKLK